ncbi:hypothetical protein [Amycolatopsis thermoflava]|uniref:hypothetical protein n=1 Tax=Amycolatopsis thermoflava TaxID=84480 RepID=UPI00040ED721|nr:hypothetical protein [Amycolatopsis thermoflava]
MVAAAEAVPSAKFGMAMWSLPPFYLWKASSAEPFAQALIATGTQLGIDQFLLVQ